MNFGLFLVDWSVWMRKIDNFSQSHIFLDLVKIDISFSCFFLSSNTVSEPFVAPGWADGNYTNTSGCAQFRSSQKVTPFHLPLTLYILDGIICNYSFKLNSSFLYKSVNDDCLVYGAMGYSEFYWL